MNRQKGWLSVEVALAAALATLGAIWAAGEYVAQAERVRARQVGTWLGEIRHATREMLWTHYDALAASQPPLGADGVPLFAHPVAPTLSELRTNGHLPNGFPEQNAAGFAVAIRVVVDVRCPGAGCRLDAFTYLSTDKSKMPVWQTAEMLVALNGYGALVRDHSPQRLRGPNVDFPNPIRDGEAALAPGTIAAWAGLDRNRALQYLRVGDTRDPQFQGSLTVAGNVAAGAVHAQNEFRTPGTVHANRVAATGDVWSDGVVRGLDIAAARNAWIDGTAHAAAVHSRGDIHAGSTLVAQDVFAHGTMGAAAQFQAGRACGRSGLLSHDPVGKLLVCFGGHWRAQEGRFGGAFLMDNALGCDNGAGTQTYNPVTGACSCPSGYTAVVVSYAPGRNSDISTANGYVCVR